LASRFHPPQRKFFCISFDVDIFPSGAYDRGELISPFCDEIWISPAFKRFLFFFFFFLFFFFLVFFFFFFSSAALNNALPFPGPSQ